MSSDFSNIGLTDGLYEACCDSVMLSAAALGENVNEVRFIIDGEPYEASETVSAPLYANEFRS